LDLFQCRGHQLEINIFSSGNQFGGGLPPYGQGFQPSYQNPGFQVNSFWQPGASNNPGSSFPYSNQPRGTPSRSWNMMQQPRLPFLETLNFPYLSKLMNDPVCHDPNWPPVPTKLPSDIPKFEGKVGEDPSDHVTTFHLWCSSNSLNDDSIHLHLFQHTLTRVIAKWYIELKGESYHTFHDLALVFLNHFQLPVHYDVGTDLLSTFQ
jgi:hypothetical protein